jgi:hypothetical protein
MGYSCGTAEAVPFQNREPLRTMEADWEVEVGGGAPVIEALWPGFVDLRRNPERIGEIQEAAAFPALAGLLRSLNGAGSPVWTAKCDLWEPEANELACYVDLLPVAGVVFAQWEQAEAFCRELAARLAPVPLPECRVDLVVRQAIAGDTEGFGVTATLSATGEDQAGAAEVLTAVLVAFAGAVPPAAAAGKAASKLQ